ncbi:hypothetical protein LA76x_4141 [Lysobacter antibioticus]|uniref:Uncharacterized protein n=1 Tax=Lysobacter antibioticus TaxID=84531 RepID=A0A0S2FFG7_LYSAN|nr:hypothetical protein LA76x_4141 [Lysobacter antibioticus]
MNNIGIVATARPLVAAYATPTGERVAVAVALAVKILRLLWLCVAWH